MSTKTDVKIKQSNVLAQSSALALATGMLFSANAAYAQSFEGSGVVVEGSATITTSPGTTDVTVESNSAVIDWTPTDNNGFGDILFQQDGTTATFINGSGITDYAVLNRILPADPGRRVIFDGAVISRIQDGMGSTPGGTVFFYTPGGIVIGSNAVFDVGNLGLTTAAPLTDGNGNFIINDTVQFQNADSATAIDIQAGAFIDALSEGSYVAMFAPRIRQAGEIYVNGQAVFAAGEAGSITFSPDGLFDIQIDVGSEAGFGSIEHIGSTGGPASSGAGDNHRIYMVSIPKNTSMTMAIQGGSQLGFDIAQSATMDGNVVVLSAGHNVVGGEIEQAPNPAALGNSFINIDNISGPLVGAPILFTSQVNARAQTDVNLFIFGDTIFEEDAVFLAGSVNAFVVDSLGSLTANGDLVLVADAPRLNADVGDATLNINGGASATIAGDLIIASNAPDGDQPDLLAQGGTAGLNVNGSGSNLMVGGDLIIEASSNTSSATNGTQARAGNAFLQVFDSGLVSVDGVSRVRSSAISGIDGRATGGVVQVEISSDAEMTTGQLNVSSRAISGEGANGLAQDATAGSAEIQVNGVGSMLTVLAGNSSGDLMSGDLDFLSSVAIGGVGVNGNGGRAISGSTNLSVQNGGSIDLPDEPGNPLRIRISAIGGDTVEDDGAAGSAQAGFASINISNSTVDLGRISFVSQAIGGSILPSAERTTGGTATSFGGSFVFLNSDVDAAFDEIVFEQVGGNGTTDDQGAGGDANGGNLGVHFINSTVDILSDLNVLAFALGGDGRVGGNASSTTSTVELIDSTVNVSGDVNVELTAIGGSGSTSFIATLDAVGGAANANGGGIIVRNSDLTASGAVAASQMTRGGDVDHGDGGDANTSNTFVEVDGVSVITAASTGAHSSAIGGSNLLPGFGNGGNANAGGARLDAPNFGTQGMLATTINGGVVVTSTATGGAAGSDGGNGGEANGQFARLLVDQRTNLTITGDVVLSVAANGGLAPNGIGGAAFTDVAEIFSFAEFADIRINGNAELITFARGGDGQTGGDATRAESRILMQGGTLAVDGLARMTAEVVGGNALASATPGSGGNASGASINLFARNNAGGNPTLVSLGGLDFNVAATGGNGGNSTGGSDGGAGGNADGSNSFFFGQAVNGTVDITGPTTIDFVVTGGNGGTGDNGGAGGDAMGGSLQFGTASGGPVPNQVDGSASFTTLVGTNINRGGNGGAATTGVGGDGGRGQAGNFTVLSRGAEVSATSMTFNSEGIGGDGGAGAGGNAAGNGGDGQAGTMQLVASQAFQNPGRGVMNLGSLIMESNAQGGTGATNGASLYPEFATFSITQADVNIGTVDIELGGEAPPDPEGVAFISLIDATLVVDTFNFVTPGTVDLVANNSTVDSRVFNVTGGTFALPDPQMPPANPGTISATETISLTSTNGDLGASANLIADELISLNSFASIGVLDLVAGDITITSIAGDITTGLLDASDGTLTIESGNDILLGDFLASSLIVRSAGGAISAVNPIAIGGDATFEAATDILLGDVSASSIVANAGDLVQVQGLWQADLVDITSRVLDVIMQGAIDTGSTGMITLTSTNPDGVLLGEDASSNFDGYHIDLATFERLLANEVSIFNVNGNADSQILIGNLDLSANDALTTLNIENNALGGEIIVEGLLTASSTSVPVNVSFSSDLFGIDADLGAIDLFANGGMVTIAAGTIFIGSGGLFDDLTGDETEEELATLINTPIATAQPDGVLRAGGVNIFASDLLLIQNTGTEETPAGFVVPTANDLVINAGNDATPLFIINGQFDDGTGNVLTGDDAATALLDLFADTIIFNAGSQINGCALGGCDAPAATDQGEITSTVSAAVNGVDTSGGTTGGSSGSGSNGNGGGGADSGSGDDSGSGGDSDSSDEGGSAGTGAGTGSTGSGSSGGGDVNVDNVDDGGGGDGEFSIEDSGDSGSDGGSDSDSSSDGDSGSDSDGDGEASSEDSDESSETEESETEDSEESEDSEEESEEEEEEEASEEEEEESEGPATGPIAPPVSIISTNSLDRRGSINDPISGSGNPALVDPDVDGPSAGSNGDQP